MICDDFDENLFGKAHSYGEYLHTRYWVSFLWRDISLRRLCWRTEKGQRPNDHRQPKTWRSKTENQLKRLLPAICYTPGDLYAFQQDNARSHDAHESWAAATRDLRLHHTRLVWLPATSIPWITEYGMSYKVVFISTADVGWCGYEPKQRLIETWSAVQQSAICHTVISQTRL